MCPIAFSLASCLIAVYLVSAQSANAAPRVNTAVLPVPKLEDDSDDW